MCNCASIASVGWRVASTIKIITKTTQMEIKHWDEDDEPEFVFVEDSKAGANINCTAETVCRCLFVFMDGVFEAAVGWLTGASVSSSPHIHTIMRLTCISPYTQTPHPHTAGDPRRQAVRDRPPHRHARGGGGREVQRFGAGVRHAPARDAAYGMCVYNMCMYICIYPHLSIISTRPSVMILIDQ